MRSARPARALPCALAAVLMLATPAVVHAQSAPTPQDTQQGRQQQNPPAASHEEQQAKPPTIEHWAVHGQLTEILQYHPAFDSAYQGPQSFDHRQHMGNTVDVTLYAGGQPWRGAEVWLNLEMYQGHAPNDTLGIAGYVNGDGAKVGKNHPYTRIARLFIRQTVGLGGGTENVDPDLNQLGSVHDKNRLVFTLGKFNSTDVFDTNKYAHDARHDFLNWSAIDAGSFDYAADAWGYTYGASAEWYQGDWTGRLGLFDLSIVPNNKTLTPDLTQFQVMLEGERRFSVNGHPGSARVTGFLSRGNMGAYADATALARATGQAADVSLVRRYRSRPGVVLNVDQEVAKDVGLFARAGWSDGRYESYEYTDIDRTVEAGVSVGGARWGRKDDNAAIALVANEISRDGRRYLDARGLGILIGDGRLKRGGTEGIVEAYYSLAFLEYARLSLDYQFIANPAYNRDRGPVNVVGLRLHLQK